MDHRSRHPIVTIGLGLAFWLSLATAGAARADFAIFSGGETTPESISLVPVGFGTFGGTYFVPDAAPAGGGLTDIGATPLYATTGLTPGAGGSQTASIYTYDSSGTPTLFYTDPAVNTGVFTSPQIAPPGFGAFAGQLVVAKENSADQLHEFHCSVGALDSQDPESPPGLLSECVYFGITRTPGLVDGTGHWFSSVCDRKARFAASHPSVEVIRSTMVSKRLSEWRPRPSGRPQSRAP